MSALALRARGAALFAGATVLLLVAPAVAIAAPDTIIDSGPPAQDNKTTATFVFHSGDNTATFECSRDNGETSWVACTSPRDTSGTLSEGDHIFSVRATANGQTDATPAQYTWKVDLTPPSTTLSEKPPALTNSQKATFAFSSADSTATFRCSLNGAAATACTSPIQYTGLSDASRTFAVYAVDPAGNTDTTPESVTWTVDTIPPDTTLTAPADLLHTRSPAFTLAASEDGVTFECRLGVDTFAPCTSPATVGPLQDGDRRFLARAVDAAGNPDPTPAEQAWTLDVTPPLAPKTVFISRDFSASATASASQVTQATPLDQLGGFTEKTATPIVNVRTAPFTASRALHLQWSAVAGAVAYNETTFVTYAGTAPNAAYIPGFVKHHNAFTGTALNLSVPAGRLVCVTVSALDAAGNTSPAMRACTTVPFGWPHFPTDNLELKPSPPAAGQLDDAKPMKKVSDAKSWQGTYLKGPIGSGVFLYANCCSAGDAGPAGCWYGCGSPLPFYVGQINRAGVIVTTCSHCGKLRVGFTYDTVKHKFIGKTQVINLHSKHTHRGKIVTIKAKAPASSGDKQVVIFKVLSGKPRIEGIAGMPSSESIAEALGPAG
jgi:hypothetical protein